MKNVCQRGFAALLSLAIAELAEITRLDVSRQGIADLTGIAYFPNLESLNCKYNSERRGSDAVCHLAGRHPHGVSQPASGILFQIQGFRLYCRRLERPVKPLRHGRSSDFLQQRILRYRMLRGRGRHGSGAQRDLAAVPTLEQEKQPGGGAGGGAGGSTGGGAGGGTTPPVEVPGSGETEPDDSALENWENPFSDVAQEAWYFDAVRYAAYHGLMEGLDADTFSPDTSLTRAQLAQILYNLEGRPEAGSVAGDYADVAAGAWYKNAVSWAVEAGILTGYGNGSMEPDRLITREQLATMLHRYAAGKGYDTDQAADLSGYADGGSVSPYAGASMQWAVAAGILNGTGSNTLSPAGNASRAQSAAMLMRFLEQPEP